MDFYTSNFASLKKIPTNLFPVSISISKPKWFDGDELPLFYPTWNILNRYKNGQIDSNTYTEEYLNLLNSRKKEIDSFMLNLKECNITPVFLCYEKPTDFCHRHLVSQYLKDLGLKSEELKF